MCKKRFLIPRVPVLFFLILFCVSVPFAAHTAEQKIENSLPQEKLARYNDSFDTFRDDLWEKSAWAFEEKAKENFKYADVTIEEGQIKIQTKVGSFSKGALGARYSLKGDFDIQIDCHVDFLKEITDMDQQVGFSVVRRGKDKKDIQFITLLVRKNADTGDRVIDVVIFERGRFKLAGRHYTENFHGALRMVRAGKKLSARYKKEGQPEWKTICTLSFTDREVFFGFLVQNFKQMSTTIKALAPFTARFDNFRINGAQGIIEEEI